MKNLRCCACAWVFGIPDDVYNARFEDGEAFWCPLGHQQSFTKTKDQKTIERLNKDIEWNEGLITGLMEENEELKKADCPVCGERFLSVGGHMAAVHPSQWAEIKANRLHQKEAPND